MLGLLRGALNAYYTPNNHDSFGAVPIVVQEAQRAVQDPVQLNRSDSLHESGAVIYAVQQADEAAGGKLVEVSDPRLTTDEEVVAIVSGHLPLLVAASMALHHVGKQFFVS